VTRVVDNPGASRYEVYVDETRAGFVEYELRGDAIVLVHTEVDPVFEGRGLGSQLAAGALDGARSRNLRVVPLCPFISRYLSHHPEYADLLRRR
jgi:predicted GNAT family acetyltransferase